MSFNNELGKVTMYYVIVCSLYYWLMRILLVLYCTGMLSLFVGMNANAQSTRYLLPKVFDADFARQVTSVANDTPGAIYRTPIRGQGIYDNRAKVFGKFIIGRAGILGKGLVSVEGSLARGNDITFKEGNIYCSHGKFIVKSSNPSKPVLRVEDVNIQYVLDSQIARIEPVDDVEFINFPNHHYILGFHEFVWPFAEQDITVVSTLDTLGNPFPIHVRSTSSEHKGLAFNGTVFNYRFAEDRIKVGGVKEIELEDVLIIPKDSSVTILPDGSLDTLMDATVRFKAGQKSIRAESKGNITISSRTEYSGVGKYEFINYRGERYLMDIKKHESPEALALASEGSVFLSVPKDEPIEAIPGFLFTGQIILSPKKNDFEFAGMVAVNQPKSKKHSWSYIGTGGFGIELPRNTYDAKRNTLHNGLYLTKEGNIKPLLMEADQGNAVKSQLFSAYGKIRYNLDTNAYQTRYLAGEEARIKHLQYYEYFPETQKIGFNGFMTLNKNSKNIAVKSSGIGQCDAARQLLSCRATIELSFRTNKRPFSVVASAFRGFSPMTYVDNPKPLYRNLRNFIPAEDMDIFQQTLGTEWNLLSFFVNSIVLADIDLHWSGPHQAFYSKGQIAVSNFFKNNVNARLDGFVYIPMEEGTDELHFYLKGNNDQWYYFKRKGDYIYVHSTNKEINEYYSSKDQRIKLLEEEEALEMIEFYQSTFLEAELPR